jgi:SAM-dependent methyltransferase
MATVCPWAATGVPGEERRGGPSLGMWPEGGGQTVCMAPGSASLEDLLAEGEAVPVAGWDFSWFEGRATEERPSWGYTRQAVPRIASADALLDVQTGGGEVLAEMLGRAAKTPRTVAATESWSPNLELARPNLARFGVSVVQVDDPAGLPFADESFDLVVSRHPTITVWPEVARVLRTDGAYFAQHVGARSNRELAEFMMGPLQVSDARSPERAVAEAEAAGLMVLDVRHEALRAEFNDVAAVVYFLRKVVWTVPGFTVDRYRDRLTLLHERIEEEGPFVSYAQRFLIEARQPG